MPNAAELWKSASPASKISLLVKYISIQMINMIYSVSKGPIDVRHKTKLTVNDWCGQINFHSTAMSNSTQSFIQIVKLWTSGITHSCNFIDTKLQKVRFYTVITRTSYPLCFQYTWTLYKRLPANIYYVYVYRKTRG